MRGILKRALAAVAMLVLVPVEVVVRGVRMIISVLMPQRPAPLSDVAAAVVDEAEETPAGRSLEQIRQHVSAPSEAERVRRAARQLIVNREIPSSWLDPKRRRDAEILAWLAQRDGLDLSQIVKATEKDIVLHLAGTRTLRMPLLPSHCPKPAASPASRRVPSRDELLKEMMLKRVHVRDLLSEDRE